MFLTVTDNISDELLFQRLQTGDAKSFETLFYRYYPLLCAYAKQYVELNDAEEIVQDVMLWVWENRGMCVIESSLKSYLFKAVKNKCLTLISHNELKHVVAAAYHESLPQYEDPDFYIVEELTQNIDAAMRRLPDSYREAFEMNRIRHMTYKEIAVHLDVSPKTVDYRIQQALKLLRVELKDYLPMLLILI